MKELFAEVGEYLLHALYDLGTFLSLHKLDTGCGSAVLDAGSTEKAE